MAAPNILSATSIYGKTVGAALGTTLTTSLLANASGSNKVLKINSIIVANVDGSNAADVSVEFYNGSVPEDVGYYNSYGVKKILLSYKVLFFSRIILKSYTYTVSSI